MVPCSPQALKNSRNTSTPASLKSGMLVQLADWTVEQVAHWAALTSLPLEVAEKLKENAINGQVLDSLTEQDMLAIGLDKFGWRRQLLLSRQELREQLEQLGLARQASPDHGEGAEVIQIHSPTETPKDTPRGISPRLVQQDGVLEGFSTAPSVHSTTCSMKSMPNSVQATFHNDLGKMPATPSLRDMATQTHDHDAHRDKNQPAQADLLSASAPTWFGAPHDAAFPMHGHQVPDGRPMRMTSICEPVIRVQQVENSGAYLVDNSYLRSGLPGLDLHPSMSLTNTEGCSYVPWGSVIYGTPFANDWVKMGEFFLPMHLNGVPVLKRQPAGNHYPVPASVTGMSNPPSSTPQPHSMPVRRMLVTSKSPTSSTRTLGVSGHNNFASQRSIPVVQVVSSSQPAVSALGVGPPSSTPADGVQSQSHRSTWTPGMGWRPTMVEANSPSLTYRETLTQSTLASLAMQHSESRRRSLSPGAF